MNNKMELNPSVNSIIFDNEVGFDIETTGLNPRTDKIVAFAVAGNKCRYVFQINKYSTNELKKIFRKLALVDITVAHNAKFDASFVYTNYGILLENLYCTMLASQILRNYPDRVSHSLINCLDGFIGVKEIDGWKKKLMQYSFIYHNVSDDLSPEQVEYVMGDVIHLLRLQHTQQSLIKAHGMKKVIELENMLIPVLIKMEIGGCLIDYKGWYKILGKWEGMRDASQVKLDSHLVNLSEEYPELKASRYTRKRSKEIVYQASLFSMSKRIINENKGNINYSSSPQIIDIFKKLDLELPCKRDGEVSVDENTLKTYLTEHPGSPISQFITDLIFYRRNDKLLSTYGEKFLSKLDHHNFIHTQYTQCRTATGRLSSYRPNLQNIPRGDLRNFFKARTGHKMITCDMNSAEVAIAADYSQEPLLLDSLLKGIDIHSELASISYSIIFGEPVTIINSEDKITIKDKKFKLVDLRTDHKNNLFAKFYKCGKGKIYQQMSKYINKFHPAKDRMGVAQKISKALDNAMPVLNNYLSGLITEAHNNGFLVGSFLGRKRWFSKDAYGECANFPIQNTNAEAMKMALIVVDGYLSRTGYGRIVMNIHDEIVCEVMDKYLEVARVKIEKIMGDCLSRFLTTIKGSAEAKIGEYWKK